MTRRLLTNHEIDTILGFFDEMYLQLHTPARAILTEKLKQPLRTQLQTIEIDPFLIHKLKSELERVYRPAEPGKAVGILTAQSVGEMQTQMNLNIFHQAGYRDKQVEQASRLQELTCTSKSETQSSVTCSIYYKPGYSAAEMLSSLTFMTFSHYIVTAEITCAPPSEWEGEFARFFRMNLKEYPWVYTYTLNLEDMYRFQTTLAQIASILREQTEGDVRVAFSPLCMGQIRVRAASLSALQNVHKEFLPTRIHGISGIIQSYFLPIKVDSTDLYIETEGTNLKNIYLLPFVDTFTSTSNDMWEIYDIFGVEAVREFLVEEFTSIMPSVHFSHIELLSDRMTVSGKLRSMTRYTRKNENKASVLSKITFEETLKRTTEAAFKEQSDNMRGCSSSVICGRLPAIGTGLNELLYDINLDRA